MRGPGTTNQFALHAHARAFAGVGLMYTLEPVIADDLARGRLRVALEPYAPHVPGLCLYFPEPGAQVSPALRAFVDLARELAAES